MFSKLPLVLLVGCIGAIPPNPETQYEAEMSACVTVSKTLADSHKCRCEVDQRWGYGATSQYCVGK